MRIIMVKCGPGNSFIIGTLQSFGGFSRCLYVCLSEDVFHRYVVEIKIQAEFEDWHG